MFLCSVIENTCQRLLVWSCPDPCNSAISGSWCLRHLPPWRLRRRRKSLRSHRQSEPEQHLKQQEKLETREQMSKCFLTNCLDQAGTGKRKAVSIFILYVAKVLAVQKTYANSRGLPDLPMQFSNTQHVRGVSCTSS